MQIALSHYAEWGLLDTTITLQGIPSLMPNSISISTTGWTFVMMGRDNTANKTFCWEIQ